MIPTPPYSVADCGEVRGTGENKRNSQTRQTNRKIIGLFSMWINKMFRNFQIILMISQNSIG